MNQPTPIQADGPAPRQEHGTRTAARMHFVHLPTPGDHYSPATGSAVMTVIHGLTAPHIARGLPATILVSRGTMAGYPPYAEGETREMDLPTTLPSRPQKALDAALGRLCNTRPCNAGLYKRVPGELGTDFDGTLFVHNAPAAIPLLRSKLPNATIVLYAHNQLFNTYSAREIRHVVGHADMVACVSDFIARDIAARAGMQSPKLKTVLNGVDTTRFVPRATASRNAEPVVLFLGRVLPEKGADLLMKAAAMLHDKASPFRLRIVGSSNFNASDPLTPYEYELRRIAEPFKDRVDFVPFVPRDQVIGQYQQADIFVAPSNWDEPFGLTIAEALACGMPCVLSNRGGIPEVAGDAALYFTPPSAASLAKQLSLVLDDPRLRGALATKARARAQFLAWPNRYQSLLAALNLSPA